MAYKNRLFQYVDDYPIMSIFALPIGMYVTANFLASFIRLGRFQSAFAGPGLFDENAQGLSLGTVIRKEGGDPSDFMFRATASDRPTGPGVREQDEIQARTTGADVRYDREYHDTIFFAPPDYKDNAEIISSSFPKPVTDTYVFAGINGLHKINRR